MLSFSQKKKKKSINIKHREKSIRSKWGTIRGPVPITLLFLKLIKPFTTSAVPWVKNKHYIWLDYYSSLGAVPAPFFFFFFALLKKKKKKLFRFSLSPPVFPFPLTRFHFKRTYEVVVYSAHFRFLPLTSSE